MPRLRFKTFATPDEVRPIPNGRAEVVSLDEATVARSELDPGWRWSIDLAPIMGTRSCRVLEEAGTCRLKGLSGRRQIFRLVTPDKG